MGSQKARSLIHVLNTQLSLTKILSVGASARKTSQGGRDYCTGDLWGITFSTKSDALDLQDLSRIAWGIKGCTLFFLVVENSLSPATSWCCLPSRHLRRALVSCLCLSITKPCFLSGKCTPANRIWRLSRGSHKQDALQMQPAWGAIVLMPLFI